MLWLLVACQGADETVPSGGELVAPDSAAVMPGDCTDAAWFRDAAGGWQQVRPLRGVGGALERVRLDEPGTLYLCPGSVTLPVEITADVDIFGGDDPGAYILAAEGATPIKIRGGAVSVRGLTVIGGEADEPDAEGSTDRAGGGIFCGGAELLLSDVQVSGGSADYGGGVFAGSGCTLRIERSLLSYNHASFGGGVAVTGAGALSISDTDFRFNQVGGGYSSGGGGLMVTGAVSVLLQDSTFYGNTVDFHREAYGGGAWLEEIGSVTIEDVVFEENGLFRDNTEQSSVGGGGLAVRGGSAVTLSDCAFEDNEAEGSSDGLTGGGAHFSGSMILSIEGAEFHDNTAGDADGGGLAVEAALATLSGLTFEGNHAGSASAIDFATTSALSSLEDAVVASNTTITGTVMDVSCVGCTLSDLALTDNAGLGLEVTGSDVSASSLVLEDSGSLRVVSVDGATVSDSQLSDGSGVFVDTSDKVTFRLLQFDDEDGLSVFQIRESTHALLEQVDFLGGSYIIGSSSDFSGSEVTFSGEATQDLFVNARVYTLHEHTSFFCTERSCEIP